MSLEIFTIMTHRGELIPHCPLKISRCWVSNLLMAVGLGAISSLSVRGWRWLYLHSIASSQLSEYGAHQGAYAVITGASDGIGKELARVGASNGFNLVLVSRSKEKLEITRSELLREFPNVNIVIIDVDCGGVDVDEQVEKIMEVVRNIDVSVLWNNVAITTSTPLSLARVPNEELHRILRINNDFLVTLTAKVIPQMKTRNGKAAIANVSSFLSILPAANFVAYSASKGFVNQFSSALSCELETTNIRVTAFRPAHVATKMSGIKETSFMVPSPLVWAQCAWKKLGVSDSISPYFPHALQEIVALVTPAFLIRPALRDACKEPDAA